MNHIAQLTSKQLVVNDSKPCSAQQQLCSVLHSWEMCQTRFLILSIFLALLAFGNTALCWENGTKCFSCTKVQTQCFFHCSCSNYHSRLESMNKRKEIWSFCHALVPNVSIFVGCQGQGWAKKSENINIIKAQQITLYFSVDPKTNNVIIICTTLLIIQHVFPIHCSHFYCETCQNIVVMCEHFFNALDDNNIILFSSHGNICHHASFFSSMCIRVLVVC